MIHSRVKICSPQNLNPQYNYCRMRSYVDIHSLPVQLILSFIGIVLLTAAALGLPAIWLIQQQLDRQAWSQIDQGQRAAQALYQAKQSEVESLAILTAQRPTLNELLQQEDWQELEDYLLTLQGGAGLDLMVVCDVTDETLAATQKSVASEACQSWSSGSFQTAQPGNHSQAWLVAAHPLEFGAGGNKVIVGVILNDEFAQEMRVETGLEHTIWLNDQPLATSFIGNRATLVENFSKLVADDREQYRAYELDGEPYYAALIPLDTRGIQAEVALSIADITATEYRLVWILAGGILVVAFVGSILGVYLARRISKPLVQLAETAQEFRGGDLSSTVTVEAGVSEVSQVAQALESARVDLLETLTNLEREKAWINHLLESIVEGIVTLDHQGCISFFSKGAEQITGWERDEVLGHSVDQAFKLSQEEKPFSQLIPPAGVRKKLLVILKDEHQATLSFTGALLAPLEAGDAQVVLVFRDVSEEEMIHRLIGQFLANIAHEFRTPLSALAASIELLLDQAPDLSQAELGELLNSLYLGALGLQTLVDNLLESASIEAGRFRISPRDTDLGGIIAGAVQTMQPLLDKYEQRLVIELPTDIPVVHADERRIQQVLVNLLSNAIKFGPPGEEIAILVSIQDDFAKLQVIDRGPGIPQDQKSSVFYRIMQVETLSNSAKVGVGLGLFVVKAVVEAHGGRVGVEDRPGGGSIFWFTLPVVKT